MSGGREGGALAPPSPPKTYTMFVVRRDHPDKVYHDIVSFEPAHNAYLAINQRGRRIVVPFNDKLEAIEVVPDE